MLQFLLTNKGLLIGLAGGGFGTGAWYVFSTVMQACPPLPSNAGFWTKWAHDSLQSMAANPNKRLG